MSVRFYRRSEKIFHLLLLDYMHVHVFLMDQDIKFDCALHVYNI